MEDDYLHVDDRTVYVLENIPGPYENTEEYTHIVDNVNSQITNACDCIVKCDPAVCNCIIKSGGSNYFTSLDSLDIKLNTAKPFDIPILECNDLCPCGANCGNRLVQKGPIKHLYVKALQNKGYGLFSKTAISVNTFVCEYAGEVITKTQAECRQKFNIQNCKMNYIFCLNEYSNNIISQTFVDPSHFGNIGRYANHSCDPNCVIVPVRVNTPIPKLALFSCKDILPHTEITFDYGSSSSMNLPTNGKGTKCLCNTNKCIGWMPYQMY